jgi:hypothetical protein
MCVPGGLTYESRQRENPARLLGHMARFLLRRSEHLDQSTAGLLKEIVK